MKGRDIGLTHSWEHVFVYEMHSSFLRGGAFSFAAFDKASILKGEKREKSSIYS